MSHLTARVTVRISIASRSLFTLPFIQPIVLTQRYPLALCGLVLVGFVLRLYLWNGFPLREDEALYSYWALHFWRGDPWFLQVWPDKPPVFTWLLSLVFQLLGQEQSSGRWLNIALSTATIPILAATAQSSWGKPAGLVTALTFALNPFAISFAPTVYTDPLLVFAGSLALYLALANHAGAAGVWLGIAIMTKQQGVLYVPLIAYCVLRCEPYTIHNTHSVVGRIHPLVRFFCGLALVVCPLVYGDSLRWGVAPSPWDLSVRNYGALRMLPPSEWLARLHDWLPLLWHLTASYLVWFLLGLLVLLMIVRKTQIVNRYGRTRDIADGLVTQNTNILPAHRSRLKAGSHWVRLTTKPYAPTNEQSPPHPLTPSPSHLVTLWSLAFLILHLTTTVQPWDRYLLPLAPMLALLVGWAGAQLHRAFPRWFGVGLMGWSLCLLPPAAQATTGALPIGGDHGDYSGLTEAIQWTIANFPTQAVLYHQSLGWHYRYYLYDQVADARYELRWFPSAVYLADNSAKTAGRHQLLIAPDWASVRDLAIHLRVRQVVLHERQRFGHFTIYELVRQRQSFCTWCVCRLPSKDTRFATLYFSAP